MVGQRFDDPALRGAAACAGGDRSRQFLPQRLKLVNPRFYGGQMLARYAVRISAGSLWVVREIEQ